MESIMGLYDSSTNCQICQKNDYFSNQPHYLVSENLTLKPKSCVVVG